MRRVAALLLAGGCSFSGPGASVDGGSGSDGPTDCIAWMPRAGHIVPCTMPAGDAWTVGGAGGTFDTETGMYVGEGDAPAGQVVAQEQPDKLRMRVISVQRFTIADTATLRVVGSLPLLVLSWSDITIAGSLDASSKRTATGLERGAGSGRSDCSAPRDGAGEQDSGGGGGGGFKAGGGSGGTGEGNHAGGMFGGSISEPTLVIGGCDGADGGDTGTAASGGAGGGAIQLTAKAAIVVESTGRIHAGGTGGTGGTGEAGGGGGGSGGFIGLDAPTVVVRSNALIAANGGGGGVGCDGGDGDDGEDGKLDTSTAAGGPGTSCTRGNRGGAGGARSLLAGGAGSPSNSGGGGGGGGGGAGYIFAWAGTLTVQGADSPAIQQRP